MIKISNQKKIQFYCVFNPQQTDLLSMPFWGNPDAKLPEEVTSKWEWSKEESSQSFHV